jgi:hypothetical protein
MTSMDHVSVIHAYLLQACGGRTSEAAESLNRAALELDALRRQLEG